MQAANLLFCDFSRISGQDFLKTFRISRYDTCIVHFRDELQEVFGDIKGDDLQKVNKVMSFGWRFPCHLCHDGFLKLLGGKMTHKNHVYMPACFKYVFRRTEIMLCRKNKIFAIFSHTL